MAPSDADLWHQVHAQREDGVAAMFLIREVDPRPDQPQIFVIELPYPITELSKLPDAAGYRRLDTFQEQWIEPACEALGWTFVAWKCEDGAFFLYLYGAGDPNALYERLAPFDGALGFFNDRDASWTEYAALRELVDQAQAADDEEDDGGHVHTEACGHDHDHGATTNGIPVVDLTSARATGKATPDKAKAAKATAAKAKAAKATPGKPSSAKPTSAKKPAKPAPAPAPARATKAKPAAKKPAAKPAAKKPAAKPAAKKPATKPAAKKPATKPAKAKPAAKKPAARKPASRR